MERVIMRRTQAYIYTLLAGCLALSGSLAVNADTTQITTTTTRSSLPTYVFAPASTYFVVDPISGVVQGNYDLTSHLVNGQPLRSGWVVVDNSTRAMVATVDSYGNIVDVSLAPAERTMLVTFDSRRKDLEQQIAEAQAKGRLAAAQAEALRLQLSGIPVYDPNTTVTYSRAIEYGSGLNAVSSRLLPVTQKTYSSVIAPQFVTIDGKLTVADDMTYRKIQLTRRIEDEYGYGRINKAQMEQFKSDLDTLSALNDINSLQVKLDSAVVVK